MKLFNGKSWLYILGILAGMALAVGGGFLRDEELKALSGVCIGVGAGLFGMSVANLVTYRMRASHPEVFAKKDIEVNDERNTIVRDKAGAKVNGILMIILAVITLVFVLLDVELYVSLTLAGLILLQGVLYTAYFSYFNNRL